jgi:hypothetical protein
MVEYRIHVISRHGSIIRTAVIQCHDDREAQKMATALAEYNDVELWHAGAMIATIPATKA